MSVDSGPRHRPGLMISAATTVALVAAFFVLPGAVAEAASARGITTSTLADEVGRAFGEWWRAGAAPLTPGMEAVVSFWQVFHVTKALIALALLVSLLAAGYWFWKASADLAGRASRVGATVLGILPAPAAPIVLLILMANIQGAIAPLSSVLGLLPLDGSVPAVALVREQLAAGVTGSVLDTMIADFRAYHLVMVVTAAIAVILVIAADVVLWVRWRRMPRAHARLRHVTGVVAVVLPLLIAALLVILLANLSTVIDTAPALAAFFEGGR